MPADASFRARREGPNAPHRAYQHRDTQSRHLNPLRTRPETTPGPKTGPVGVAMILIDARSRQNYRFLVSCVRALSWPNSIHIHGFRWGIRASGVTAVNMVAFRHDLPLMRTPPNSGWPTTCRHRSRRDFQCPTSRAHVQNRARYRHIGVITSTMADKKWRYCFSGNGSHDKSPRISRLPCSSHR